MAAPIISSLFTGMKLPFFKKKGRPSPVSAADLNVLVRVLNAFLNPKVVVGQGNRVDIADGVWMLTIDNTILGSGTAPAPASGINYRGTYDNAQAYAEGDVVRVRNGSYPLGVWICVQAVNANGTPPSFPEPNDTNPALSNTWELLSLSPKTFQGCAGGANHNFYIAMIEQ